MFNSPDLRSALRLIFERELARNLKPDHCDELGQLGHCVAGLLGALRESVREISASPDAGKMRWRR